MREIAAEIGYAVHTVRDWLQGLPRTQPQRPVPLGRVANDVLRDAYLRSRRAPAEVARLGGFRDSTEVEIMLGIREQASVKAGRRYTYHRRSVSLDDAERLAHAIGVDPWEVDL